MIVFITRDVSHIQFCNQLGGDSSILDICVVRYRRVRRSTRQIRRLLFLFISWFLIYLGGLVLLGYCTQDIVKLGFYLCRIRQVVVGESVGVLLW